LPHLQKAYELYKNDPKVRFVMVSLDDDPKRLERYVQAQKFEMPIARIGSSEAAERFNVNDTPTTFYVDPQGTIRYEAKGMEIHGDALERVRWYIEELKR